jgi:coproporphyrinogen III oxidase-like Fe-S oxidoreductase
VAEARTAFDIARKTFDRISFDLIYARQYQTLSDWQAELNEALSMAVDHLSLYQLTIEPGTAFGARAAKGGLHGLPDDDISADMYLATQDICAHHGLPAYEVSNHARPGARSRHNLIYWRYGDYAGIGPGAHGRLTLDGSRWATQTPLMPNRWLEQVETKGHGETPREAIPLEEQALEHIMMGLRLAEGLDMERFARLNGAALPQDRIDALVDQGLIETNGPRLSATAAGRAVLNGVLRELLT